MLGYLKRLKMGQDGKIRMKFIKRVTVDEVFKNIGVISDLGHNLVTCECHSCKYERDYRAENGFF